MDFLQNLIHKLEVEGGTKYLRVVLFGLAVVLLVVGYDAFSFKNLATQEAMDSAQLARNISQGKGFSTLFIRPASIYLVKKRYEAKHGLAPLGSVPDEACLKGNHPDIANPPLYPVLLAGLMKVVHFDYDALPSKPKPFWFNNGMFARYPPDFAAAIFNQVLFLAIVVLTYSLARRLFEVNVARVSALLLLGTELFWRFSVSGLSTMLLLLIFMGLIWVLVLIEAETREPRFGSAALLVLAGIAGALVGLGALTRYAFLWLIVPLLFFLALVSGRRRAGTMGTAFVAFAVILTPWVVLHNMAVSGLPFGTATYALLDQAGTGDHLLRSIEPDVKIIPKAIFLKLLVNLKELFQGELFKFGGSWVSAFFLAGLLVSFTSPAVQRLRWFLLSSLVVLALAQALGKTQLSEDSPELNSENLLVLLAPLVFIFGVSLFYLLLDQVELPFRELRYLLVAGFCAVACLPMVLTFFPPRTSPVNWPPYYPPYLQRPANLMKEDELTMSDIPWAMAWYGQRQCVWLTLNCRSDFLAINDYDKAVSGLYLSPRMLNGQFFAQWQPNDDQSWGSLILQRINPRSVADRVAEMRVPTSLRNAAGASIFAPSSSEALDLAATFPLHVSLPMSAGAYPEQLFLTDRQRRPRIEARAR